MVVDGDTAIGPGCAIWPFASVGATPQDKKLQPDDEILNPYFGAAMLHCGYIRETLAEGPSGR